MAKREEKICLSSHTTLEMLEIDDWFGFLPNAPQQKHHLKLWPAFRSSETSAFDGALAPAIGSRDDFEHMDHNP